MIASIANPERLHLRYQLQQPVIELIGSVSGSLDHLREQTSFLSYHDTEAGLCCPRFKLVEELQFLFARLTSCFALLLLYHLGSHLVEANNLWLRTKVISEHVVMSRKQGSTTDVIDEISQDTVGDGVAIECRRSSAKLIHDHQRILRSQLTNSLSFFKFDEEGRLVLKDAITCTDTSKDSINH